MIHKNWYWIIFGILIYLWFINVMQWTACKIHYFGPHFMHISNFWSGGWELGYFSTQIWNFPNISLFPTIVSLKSFGNSWGNSWLIWSVLKHCKIPKYNDGDCLKIFFLLSTVPMIIQISGKKNANLVKKVSPIKKLPASKGDGFLESFFDLN